MKLIEERWKNVLGSEIVKISIQKIVQKAADEALDNATINNIPFREWIDNVNNAYENKKCNLDRKSVV